MSEVAIVTPSLAAEGEAASGVSWSAVIAGAVVSAAFSLALIAVGAGIGLISVSPWSTNNPSVTTFGVLAGAWLIAVQLFSCGVGGYFAGRMRGRWFGAHDDEVYFRDTAHGLLVWGLGAIISAGLLASATASLATGAAHAVGAVAQTVGQAAAPAARAIDPTAYFSDMLLRTDHPAAGAEQNPQAEMQRILARAVSSGDLPAADKTYVASVVASRTGLSQADAEKRVTDVFAQAKAAEAQVADKAKAAADAARKTGAAVALWAFIALLVGAFSAAFMATVGGATRDEALVVED
jgi:hypothetical protein